MGPRKNSLSAAEAAIAFLEGLKVPEGPLAGKKIRLAEFQKAWIRGALAEGTSIAALSVGRGNGKTMLGAGLALASLIGVLDKQPRRSVLIAAKTKDQGAIAWKYIEGLAQSLPLKVRKALTFVRAPRLQIRFASDGGGHTLDVLASDAKNALGLSPVFALCDERGFWPDDKGDSLENAITSACGKRNGKVLLISTSAPSDSHPFSRLLDDPSDGIFVAEYRAPEGLTPDSAEAILAANPGAAEGIGGSLEWLQAAARRAVQRGGSALSNYRLFHLNQRCSAENRAVLISVDRWLACEVQPAALPPRSGPLCVGIDLGGSSSMSAWTNYWPQTGRLECHGAFPTSPELLDRGRNDGVGGRYQQMQEAGELMVCGQQVVDIPAFVSAMIGKLEGYAIQSICCDRFRQSEFLEALGKTSLNVVPTWRGQGWKDSAEDVERFRQFVFDKRIAVAPSLLLRSALADCITLVDPTGAAKIAKARSHSRVDAATATVMAIGEGSRVAGRTIRKAKAPQWA
ncbi:MAG: terminase large subunit [Bradyrhizobium sp.]|nr:terminase large subunit [Bradyrhizobium sp.]